MAPVTFRNSATPVRVVIRLVELLTSFVVVSLDVFAFFNSLTYYYEGHPYSPNWPKRKQSHPCAFWRLVCARALFVERRLYSVCFVARVDAGTRCDCLHINLTMCETRPSSCDFWPIETYLNMPWVLQHQMPGFPSNAWFEGSGRDPATGDALALSHLCVCLSLHTLGLTYPGEWGFPISCQNLTLGSQVCVVFRCLGSCLSARLASKRSTRGTV